MLKSITGALWIYFGLVVGSSMLKIKMNGLDVILLLAIAGILFTFANISLKKGKRLQVQFNLDSGSESAIRKKYMLVNLMQYGAIAIAGVLTYVYNPYAFLTLFPLLLSIISAIHFFPLGKMFGSLPLYLTGAAILAVVAITGLVSPSGVDSYLSPIGTGIIFWGSTIYDLGISASARRKLTGSVATQ
jgi:hypothetical protein